MGLDGGEFSAPRAALFESLGIARERVFACRQSHSRAVALADMSGPRVLEADGLAGIGEAVLTVTVADCLPVYLSDMKSGAFALCHSGWKGTGIAISALRLMALVFGTKPSDVVCVLGPCVQGSCYQVDRTRADAFNAEFGRLPGVYPAGAPVRTEEDGRGTAYFLDMQAANAKILYDYGVKTIERRTECTLCGAPFGSFRREGESFTKMMALSGLFNA